MERLVSSINALKKSKVKKLVDARMKEFKQNKNYFSELCFCLLTANFQAERSIQIQNKLSNKFSTLSQKQLAAQLKKLGHRFPNKRAEFIYEARKHKKIIQDRDWLVKNIKGLGYKEASHFLRNIGHTNYALVDFHIVDLLVRNKIIKRPKTITPKIYLQIENKLQEIANKTNLNQAELDLYLWYMETGKVLK